MSDGPAEGTRGQWQDGRTMMRTGRQDEPARGRLARARGEAAVGSRTRECSQQELPVAGTMEAQITERPLRSIIGRQPGGMGRFFDETSGRGAEGAEDSDPG